MVVQQVAGVPDLYVIDRDGHQYRRNKHDVTKAKDRPQDFKGVIGGVVNTQQEPGI